jgi:hypothetical protein
MSRSDGWLWAAIGVCLVLAGLTMSCHHEDDAHPWCAEKSCEVTP